jgi:hypothetical protein
MATATLNATNSGSITITLTGVTNGSTAISSAIDNSTNKYLSANVKVQVRTNSAGTSSTGSCSAYLVRSTDGGTNYDDATATFLGTIPTVANSTTYTRIFSTEPVGPLGTHWKLAVVNNSGATLDASVGGAQFAGIKYDVT